MRLSLGLLLLGPLALGCGGAVEVSKAMTPAQARQSGLEPVAIVRSTNRMELPKGARIEKDRVVVVSRVPVGNGDVVEQNEWGEVTALRRIDGTRTTFRSGSATLSPTGDEVVGELDAASSVIPLLRHDRIEVRGTFEPDTPLPFGGSVERRRPFGLLFGGATILVLAYAPSAYVGAISPRKQDRVLLVPVAGPFIDYANRPTCTPPAGAELLPVDMCIEEKASRAALIASGSLQGLGALLFALGLPARTHIIPPPEGASGKKTRAASWQVLPTRRGMEASGTF